MLFLFITTELITLADTSPPLCVFQAFTNASVEACDGLDGVQDGVIALPGLCDFDPSSLVGTTVECSDLEATVTITESMANLVRDIWAGPIGADNQSLWYGRLSSHHLKLLPLLNISIFRLGQERRSRWGLWIRSIDFDVFFSWELLTLCFPYQSRLDSNFSSAARVI